MESHFGQKGIEFQKGYRVEKILPRTTGKLVQFRTFENRVPRYLKITYREYAAKITYRENAVNITYREYAANITYREYAAKMTYREYAAKKTYREFAKK